MRLGLLIAAIVVGSLSFLGSAGAASAETVRCHLDGGSEQTLSREACRDRLGLVLGPASGAVPEAPAPHSAPADSDLSVRGFGSGFAVNRAGDVVTNFHVVEGCDAFSLVHDGRTFEARLGATDERNDLALLRSDWRPAAYARISPGGPRLAGQVIAAGYPLADVLGSSLSVTVGYVSALAGMEDDDTTFRFTAQVQPGNSGGPLIDDRGDIVGVNVAILAGREWVRSGVIPQNVNFAIKSAILETFLKAEDVAFDHGGTGAAQSPSDLAEDAARYTPQVICLSAGPLLVKEKRAR